MSEDKYKNVDDAEDIEDNEDDSEEQNEETSTIKAQNARNEQIIETGATTVSKGRFPIHCLTIVGQIEGHYTLPPQNKTTKYEHVIPQLVAIQEDPDIKGLIIILNTVGGDVEAGLAIAELIAGMNKPTVSLVLGGGHSIGVPLAVSAQQSFIVSTATMTIHPVRMNGVVLGVPQTLSYFDKMQERIVKFVEKNSKISSGSFRKLMMNTGELVMDVGTVLDGKQAVKMGLIDNLGGLSDAITCLYDMIEEKEGTAKSTKKSPAKKEAPKKAAPKAAKAKSTKKARVPQKISASIVPMLDRASDALADYSERLEQETGFFEGQSSNRQKAREVYIKRGRPTSPGDTDPHNDPDFKEGSFNDAYNTNIMPSSNHKMEEDPFGFDGGRHGW